MPCLTNNLSEHLHRMIQTNILHKYPDQFNLTIKIQLRNTTSYSHTHTLYPWSYRFRSAVGAVFPALYRETLLLGKDEPVVPGVRVAEERGHRGGVVPGGAPPSSFFLYIYILPTHQRVFSSNIRDI